MAAYRAAKRRGQVGRISATPVRQHLLKLRHVGTGTRLLMALTQLSRNQIKALRAGDQRTVRRSVAARILAVPIMGSATYAMTSSERAVKLLERLREEGYTEAQIRQGLQRRSPIRYGATMRLATAQRIEALYRRWTE